MSSHELGHAKCCMYWTKGLLAWRDSAPGLHLQSGGAVVQGNWLKEQGVGKGDVVAVYMPMIPELPIAMLACARIGAVHNVVFGGFSADALSARVVDSKSAPASSNCLEFASQHMLPGPSV